MPRVPRPLPLVLVLIAVLLAALPVSAKPLPKGAKVLLERTTNYHHIQVYDLNGVRTLSFDGSEESIMDLQKPVDSGFEYIQFFHAPFAINGAISRVLLVGLGGASAAKQFQKYYPEVQLDIVELDPVVVDIAKSHFQFVPGPKTHIYTMDGRQFLKGTTAKYDLILMDAYTSNPYGSFIPWHLATKEFFALAKSRLNTGGLLAYNVIGQLSYWRKNIMASMFKTMETSFPTIYMLPADTSRNVVMIGATGAGAYTPDALVRSAQQFAGRRQIAVPGFAGMMRKVYSPDSRPEAYRTSPILLDDHAPVDGLVSD